MQKTRIIKSRINKRWTAEEDILFQTLIDLYCRDFQVISEQMNKSYNQVRSHYYNQEKKHSMQKAEANHIISNEYTDKKQETPYKFIVFDFVK
ncbi:SANT/Myb_domain [Hexamita inflata]|uniref:SANT/Myb domain n=1 Tax=Hexamita inflata TaxID=28002 RepID=A0AA86PR61_9EUKA|nr:SANT/Myb domain [Hexamita inflata]CAI9943730.1 SANT/Myb domain [Hexamita inflata]